MPRARANACCPKKDTKRTNIYIYIALKGFISCRNRLKHWIVCNICSIDQRVASNAKVRANPCCPQRTQKGHKCLYYLEGLQIKQICTETLACVQQGMYTCSIHQRIAQNAQGKLKSKKDKKYYCPEQLQILQK